MADGTCAFDWCPRPMASRSCAAPYCEPCYTRRNDYTRRGIDPDRRPRRHPSRGDTPLPKGRAYTVKPSACIECLGPLRQTSKANTNIVLVCSKACKQARWLRKQPKLTCEQCGTEYPKPNDCRATRYCSRLCAVSARSGPRGAASSLTYFTCTICKTMHTARADRVNKRPPCCEHLCACGSPRYRGEFSKCGPCQYRYNKDAYIHNAHIRRDRLIGTKTERIGVKALAERDGWRCHLCKRKVRPSKRKHDPLGPSIDHLLPVSQGGTHTWDNVALAHERCNLSKGARAVGDQLRLIA